MNDIEGKIQYRGKEYRVVFNLNVMAQIQAEYGSVMNWAGLTDMTGEPDAKAVIFGYMCMINEGIDIDNEENGTNIPPMTRKQVGRLITEIGLPTATAKMNAVVINSTESAEKNA